MALIPSSRGYDETSQFGEDGLIEAALEMIGEKNRWCFEVGAADGAVLSNTWRLRRQGWTAVLAEADDRKFECLEHDFGNKAFCVHRTVTDLDGLLAEFDAPQDIDLGIIDIDGQDYWLWFDMQVYRPRVLLVEFNPYTKQETYDPDHPVPRGLPYPWQTAKQPMIRLGEQKGYRLAAETFCNLLFIDRSQLPCV